MAAEVGGRHLGCTNEVPVVLFWQSLEYRNESRLPSDRPLSWFALPHSRLPLAVYRTRLLLLTCDCATEGHNVSIIHSYDHYFLAKVFL